MLLVGSKNRRTKIHQYRRSVRWCPHNINRESSPWDIAPLMEIPYIGSTTMWEKWTSPKDGEYVVLWNIMLL